MISRLCDRCNIATFLHVPIIQLAACKYSVDMLQQDQEELFLDKTKPALEITKCHFTHLHFTELVTLELHEVERRVEHVQNILDNINIPEK